MRVALHILATLALVPYVALASAFLLLGQAIATGTIFGLFGKLLSQVLWIFPWGIFGFAIVIAVLAGLGTSERLRWLGGLCVALLAAVALTVIVTLHSSRIEMGQALFLLPCALALGCGVWLAVIEWPTRARDGTSPMGNLPGA